MEVSENPEEITTESASYPVNWDLAKTDRRTDIKLDIGHQWRNGIKVNPEQVLERNEPDPCPWQQR